LRSTSLNDDYPSTHHKPLTIHEVNNYRGSCLLTNGADGSQAT
jgi:hypothetical protein